MYDSRFLQQRDSGRVTITGRRHRRAGFPPAIFESCKEEERGNSLKEIYPAVSLASALFGRQRYEKGTEYRLTKHCVRAECEDGTLFFHTMMGTLLLLEKGRSLSDQEQALVEAWFLVPKEHDEMKALRKLRALACAVQPNSRHVTGFTILTTTDCNARCFYCYEAGCKRITMSKQTARDVGAYIARVSGGEQVKIHWFGGEPLCNPEAMDIICDALSKAGISFVSSVTTNGYYLTPELTERAMRDWHVTGALIAIDGTKEVYQRTKAYIERDETAYERVLSNIEHALDAGLMVCARLNVDEANADDLNVLIDELAERYAGKQGFYVNITPLQEIKGRIHHFATERELAETIIRLRRKKSGYGIRSLGKLERKARSNHCMADVDVYEVLMPDGRICKCEHFADEEMIGNIYASDRDQEKIDAWKKQRAFYPECTECALAPRCVLLEKCERVGECCTEHVSLIGVDELKEQMLLAYQDQKMERNA